MKHSILLVFLFLGLSGLTQGETLDICDVKVDGLCFRASKDSVIARFGKPKREYRPKYECGFLSESEQKTKYYTLEYTHFYLTGNEKEDYLFEKITLGPSLSNVITIKGVQVSHRTSISELEKILGVKSNQFGVILYFKNADDGILFLFEKGLLKTISYSSPC
jgi:hypothetical protein